MTMVEKVARASQAERAKYVVGRGLGGWSVLDSERILFGPVTGPDCQLWIERQVARAAIKALEIPNERMVAAMAWCLPLSVPEHQRRDIAAEMWEAGVRAALSDGEPADG